MPNQRNPDERSTKRPAEVPDHTSPHPSGNEVFDASNAETPPRETDRLYGPGGERSGRPPGDAETARLQEAASGSFNRLTASAEDLTVQARQVYGSSQAFVRAHPASTLAGALAVGVVIGLLLGRD